MAESPYMYQLINATYNSIKASDTKLWVVDKDESKLTVEQISDLSSDGKTLVSYLEFGQGRRAREYSANWDVKPPEYLIGNGQNGFDSAYSVKYWHEGWQQQVLSNLLNNIMLRGYEGVVFDVTDAFLFPDVKAAYEADRARGLVNKDVYQEMEDFIVRASEFAKKINPDFKIIPNNPLMLFNANREKIIDINAEFAPNTRLLNALDGVVKEAILTLDNQLYPAWSRFDLKYIQQALNADKFVLGIEYPSDPKIQSYVVDKLLELSPNYIPLITDRALSDIEVPINVQTAQRIKPEAMKKANGDTTTGLVMNGSDAMDVRIGQQGNDTIALGGGNDAAFAQAGNDVVFADAGNDTVYGGAGNDTIYGWSGNDLFFGEQGNDFLGGDVGNDTLNGGVGNDTLYGGEHHDSLVGGEGDDFIAGESGNDLVKGDSGNDTLYGGAGNDSIWGWTGNDLIYGEQGNDRLGGDLGDDTLYGGSGNDSLFGWEGNDVIYGNESADIINGEAGNDMLYSGSGNNSVYGGVGNDVLVSARSSANLLEGGAGNDVFIFEGAGRHRISDFTDTQDILRLTQQTGVRSMSDLNISFNATKWQTVIASDNGAFEVELFGNVVNLLSASDFEFVS
ncbi:MAG: hypothetical protein EAY65_03355 [Alphaproteobacteria bacterium]|nr:MAG: hypothetical protein EAY65_03355 [Alphaproteobacteria bacterium]